MAASLPFQTTTDSKLVGLKTLADGRLSCPCPSNCVSRNFVASRSVSPSALTDGDAGSAGDEDEEEDEDNACWGNYGRGNGRRLPPAIPLLARTGNLSCHMPWILKRNYKADGSLVITEVRVKHHEYFRTRRANGRLVLQLVVVDENSPLFGSGPKCDDEGMRRKGDAKKYDMKDETIGTSTVMLSSSMPEPAFPNRGSSLLHEMRMSRMRPVRA